MHSTRVFLHELPWDLRARNTDWRYVRHVLPRLHEFVPTVEFVSERSTRLTWAGNLKAIAEAAARRLGCPPGIYAQSTIRLSRRELVRSGSNVIFSRYFPPNCGDIPLVWENAIVDPEMQRSYGTSEAYLDDEFDARGRLFRQAQAVQVFSDAEAHRHAQTFPDIADRFVAVPWFAPHIHACGPQLLEKHLGAQPVRILFVGNNAWRKGLDQLFDAFLQLPAATRRRSRLTVISNFDRSRISIPASDGIVVLRGAKPETVMQEMRESHIFVNVARLETYGVVFHEAMSQGLACLAPRWEVQSELFDYGRAGLNLPGESGAIRDALEWMIESDSDRHAFGAAAWHRFQHRYAPAVVAQRYADLFHSVAGH